MINIRLTSIKPMREKILNPQLLERRLYDALDQTGNIIRSDFRKTTATWKRPVSFHKTGPRKLKGELEVIVSTDNEIYSYVEYGTKPHPIVPKKKGGRLVFRAKYKSKTRPRLIGSRRGGSSGPIVIARRVMHPGTQPRQFSATIAKERDKDLRRLVKAAYKGL